MDRAAAAASLLLTLSVLAGCTQEDTPGPAAGTSGTATTPPPPAAPADADPVDPARLQDALVREDTGHFLSSYGLDGVTVVKDGVYRISDAASASDATVSLPDGTRLRLRARVVDGVTYGQVDSGAAVTLQRCWFRYDTAADPGLAPEIGVVLGARDEGDGPEADLVATASTWGTDFVANLGLTEEVAARVPVDLDFAGDTLTGWTASLADVLDAARASGLSVPAAAYQEATEPLTVRLDRFGEAVDVAAPPSDRQVPFDPAASQDDLDAAVRACESR